MSAGGSVAHAYDADGNRVQTIVTPSEAAAATTNLLVDTVGRASCGSGLSVVAETDGNGSLTAHYVRLSDDLIEVMC